MLKNTYLHSLYFCADLKIMIVEILGNLRKIKKNNEDIINIFNLRGGTEICNLKITDV